MSAANMALEALDAKPLRLPSHFVSIPPLFLKTNNISTTPGPRRQLFDVKLILEYHRLSYSPLILAGKEKWL